MYPGIKCHIKPMMVDVKIHSRISSCFLFTYYKWSLDPVFIYLFLDFVKRIHGSCEEAQIRKLIAIKINIVQKLEKRKMKITE